MHPTVYLPANRRLRRRGQAVIVARAYQGPVPCSRKRAADAIGRASLIFLVGAGFGLAAALPLKAHAAPYGSSPVTVPASIPAENFDRGGEGIGYHDRTPGNAGGKYRPSEDVDILEIVSAAGNVDHVVNNFQTGEWLAYTIKVPSTGLYDIDLRASTTYANSAFHIKVDDQDATGPIAIPNTGGWSRFQWVGKQGIRLTAGTHVLKVFSNQQYFNVGWVRVKATLSLSTPYNGTPVDVPGTLQAERFDLGGEGIAYHDRAAHNAGKALRATEDVDIVRAANNDYVVNNLQTGEWLLYTINVTKTGQYDIGLRVASASSTSAFRVDIDDTDKTGTVSVPNTGGWDTFQWVWKRGVTLTRGKHVLKVVSARQYFNLNAIRIQEPHTATAPGPNPNPQPEARQFFCTFQSSPSECGFSIQAKSNARATIVSGGRDGSTAVRLRTEPGDSNVFGSGDSERADLSLSQGQTDCSEGKEAWWAHSVKFPTDYVPASDGFGVVMDFHHTGGDGQANFHLDSSRWDGRLHFRGYGGSQDANEYTADIGPVVKNQWYDLVYHVRWSSGSDGFMEAWVNGVKKLDHSGPTLYAGMGCYMKLANYHSPFGQASSVLHDRVIRGTTWQAVSLTPLEGVQ